MKKMMVLVLSLMSLSSYAFNDPKVGGVVTLAKGLEKNLTSSGVLYIIAKKAGPDSGPNDRTPPIAVVRVQNPKFPQAFVITPKNVVITGAPFEGPVHVIARYSPTGDVRSSAGSIEGFDPKFPSTELGNKNLAIELKVLVK
ncbi:MAG: c-type cytochrome biogenesis protein CcmI/CycH [Bacteriovorax sp.]